ncbi:hypothetical protein Patl1_27886 [Pistacia atlantica]|uniref:Uncharacterized protein n=1 Tax=Pistacia atlantica TaxID=434234 RepID=A0ACC1BED9_9ROSI|nr:hypothetical protein Patl1_27886 [Pistacia atlantica]
MPSRDHDMFGQISGHSFALLAVEFIMLKDIVALVVPAFNLLKERGVETKWIKEGYIGVKPGWTGINFPYNMSKEEFEFILAASEFMAICGQQFLRLYHFNEKTGSWCFKKSLKNFISK